VFARIAVQTKQDVQRGLSRSEFGTLSKVFVGLTARIHQCLDRLIGRSVPNPLLLGDVAVVIVVCLEGLVQQFLESHTRSKILGGGNLANGDKGSAVFLGLRLGLANRLLDEQSGRGQTLFDATLQFTARDALVSVTIQRRERQSRLLFYTAVGEHVHSQCQLLKVDLATVV